MTADTPAPWPPWAPASPCPDRNDKCQHPNHCYPVECAAWRAKKAKEQQA